MIYCNKSVLFFDKDCSAPTTHLLSGGDDNVLCLDNIDTVIDEDKEVVLKQILFPKILGLDSSKSLIYLLFYFIFLLVTHYFIVTTYSKVHQMSHNMHGFLLSLLFVMLLPCMLCGQFSEVSNGRLYCYSYI